MKKMILGLVLLTASFSVSGCGVAGNSLQEEPTEETSSVSQAESSDEIEEEDYEFGDYENGPIDKSEYKGHISYEDLARTPDEYKEEKVTLSGEVIQVIEGEEYTEYRLALDEDYDEVIYLVILDSKLESRILENDYITVYGISNGLITYESTVGGEITVPEIYVQEYELYNSEV